MTYSGQINNTNILLDAILIAIFYPVGIVTKDRNENLYQEPLKKNIYIFFHIYGDVILCYIFSNINKSPNSRYLFLLLGLT